MNRKKSSLNHKAAGGANLRATVLRLLARRDHSYHELISKLTARGYEHAVIHELLTEFQAKGYLDDSRFTSQYVRSRSKRGFGPKRIKLELKTRGIDDAIIAEHTKIPDNDWLREMQTLLRKRMKLSGDIGPLQRAKFVRFFLNRGFTQEQITALLKQHALHLDDHPLETE